jgi:hypothetical protein
MGTRGVPTTASGSGTLVPALSHDGRVMAKTVGLTELAESGTHLDELVEPGRPLLIVDLTDADWSVVEAAASVLDQVASIVIGVSQEPLPDDARPLVDRMTTVFASGGSGPAWVDADPRVIGEIERIVYGSPNAAVVLDQVLRLGSQMAAEDGVVLESLAYSMLLGGDEFARWRQRVPRGDVATHGVPVVIERHGATLRIVLNRPERRNAFGHAMRDALLEGLTVARVDPSIDEVELAGAGPAFCSGGDLDEFGIAHDVAAAHRIRIRANAGLAVHRLRHRVTAHLHGACIGAGIEVPAFARTVLAREGTWFQLPELKMGLIPGAGGTVSISRRIGRWRTAYLALSGRRLDLDTALAWGLVDGRE